MCPPVTFMKTTYMGEMRGWPTRAYQTPAALDQVAAVRLWEISEQETGVAYEAITSVAA